MTTINTTPLTIITATITGILTTFLAGYLIGYQNGKDKVIPLAEQAIQIARNYETKLQQHNIQP